MDEPTTVAALPTGRAPGEALRAYHLLFGNYWAITRPAYLSMLEIASRTRLSVPELAALQEQQGVRLANTRVTTMRDGVAIVPLQGPIFPHASGLDALSGAVGTEELGQDVRSALDDPNIKAIMLDVASPGGAVEGTAAFARQIHAANEIKPVWAYVSGDCASAAYWIASAASRVVVDETSLVGNIGVIAAVPDPHAPPAPGERPRVQFVSSQSPNKRPDPHTAEGKNTIQTSVDNLAQIFIDSVARYRGMESQAVIDAGNGGDVLVGQHAVDAGLADAVGGFEDTLADLIRQVGGVPGNGPVVAVNNRRSAVSDATNSAALTSAHAALAISTDPTPVATGMAAADDPRAELSEGGIPMTDETVTTEAVQERTPTATEAQSQDVAALRAALDDERRNTADLRAAVDRLNTSAQHARAHAEVTGQNNAGVPWRGDTAEAASLFIRMENAMGADSDDFKTFVAEKRLTSTSLYNSGAFHESGHDNPNTGVSSAKAQIAVLGEAIRAESIIAGKPISSDEAFVAAMNKPENAALKGEFISESRNDRVKRGGR